jgi:hypothetical protein
VQLHEVAAARGVEGGGGDMAGRERRGRHGDVRAVGRGELLLRAQHGEHEREHARAHQQVERGQLRQQAVLFLLLALRARQARGLPRGRAHHGRQRRQALLRRRSLRPWHLNPNPKSTLLCSHLSKALSRLS